MAQQYVYMAQTVLTRNPLAFLFVFHVLFSRPDISRFFICCTNTSKTHGQEITRCISRPHRHDHERVMIESASCRGVLANTFQPELYSALCQDALPIRPCRPAQLALRFLPGRPGQYVPAGRSSSSSSSSSRSSSLVRCGPRSPWDRPDKALYNENWRMKSVNCKKSRIRP